MADSIAIATMEDSDVRQTEDDRLLARLQSGDGSAFEEFYRQFSGRLYGFSLRLTAERADAEEITQETFVRAWRHRSSFVSLSHARNWLHRVAINLWRNQLRSRARRGPQLELEPERIESAEPGPQVGGPRLDLERAIAQLPAGSRAVLILHDVLGYHHREIGEMLEMATNTSKVQLHRARKRLRKVLDR